MNRPTGKILFAGGGTGGHIYPALATIQALKMKGDFDILYVGGYAGLENDIVPREGIAFKTLWISGFQRYWTLKNSLFPAKLLVSLVQSFRILKAFQPQVVVGTGGYVSGPVLYVAHKMGIPLLIQEQDSYPGITTRLLARYADAICLAYPEAREHLKAPKGEVTITGNPVRPGLVLTGRQEAAEKWGLDPARLTVLVLGGSQGARSLNQALAALAPRFIEKYPVQFLWQTGRKLFAEMQESAAAALPHVHLRPYLEDMGSAYSAADVIVSRAGAITLAELARVQKPAILVPYPHAAADHQRHNALAVHQAGAAIALPEEEHFTEKLANALTRLLENEQLRADMGASWRKIHKADAASQIADLIIQLMNGN